MMHEFGPSPTEFRESIHKAQSELEMSTATDDRVRRALEHAKDAREESDAWRELYRAEKHASGTHLFGDSAGREAAFRRVTAAESALHALGINPAA